MAHMRVRYLYKQILQDLSWSRVVSILGMRQTGKTTLLHKVTNSYFPFDDTLIRNKALQEEWSFLEAAEFPIAIDECQIAPAAFNHVKHCVDNLKRPGQYILTGSVRFLSKRDIKESLTGRTSILELLPMNLSESHRLPLSDFFSTLHQTTSNEKALKVLEKKARFKKSDIEQFLHLGGLPGICLKRNSVIRERLWEVHLETVLSRDIEFVAPTKLGFIKVRKLLIETLKQSGLPINKALLAKVVGTSGPTVHRMLSAFEALFLLKQHGSTYYPCDIGLDYHLLQNSDLDNRLQLLKALFIELRTQLEYRYRSHYEFSDVQTRGGIHIPFHVRLKNQGQFAITLDAEPRTSDKSQKSLTWYKKKSQQIRTIAIHLGEKGYVSSAGHLCIPIHWIF